MSEGAKEQIPQDEYEIIGLHKENITGVNVYSLEFGEGKPKEDTLLQLKNKLTQQRVAVEIGPGNQLESLLFAAQKQNAQIVIGIDPYFDVSKIESPSTQKEGMPTVILFKGDGWGDQKINGFFNTEKPSGERLSIYSQLVAPDTMETERMMGATVTKSREGYLIVLDSGAVEDLGGQYYPKGDIHRTILEEKGVVNPTSLDWIKHLCRDGQQTIVSKEDYVKGINEGMYPPSSFLRNGDMLIIEK